MSQIVQHNVSYKCDLCGKSGINPIKKLDIPVSYYMDLVNRIVISDIEAYIPYGTTHGDVCEDCLKTALKKYLGINDSITETKETK